MELTVTKMRLFLKTLSVVMFIIVIAPSYAHARLQVVATLPALGQVAKAVVGEDGDVRILARVGEDPHFVPPKPTLARHLARADLLLTVGLALEAGWLPSLIEFSRNPKIRPGQSGLLVGSENIEVLGAMEHADRSMGDVHPEGNPHWWLDPIRVANLSIALARRLAAIDPENGERYLRRAELFAKQLNDLVKLWIPKFEGFSPVVTYHDSYRYFVERFGINVIGYVEPKPGVEPSIRHLDDLVRLIGARGVKQVWVEPYHHGRVARRVASLSGAELLAMPDAVTGEGGEGYLAMIMKLLQSSLEEAQ